jgi:predicted GNAT family acetyltransferase
VRLAAAHTPPRHIVLSTCDDDAVEGVALLVDALRARGDLLPGVLGPPRVAHAFAARWCERSHVQLHFKVLDLSRVIPPAWPDGDLRAATEDDVALLSAWSHRFVDETGLPEEDRASAAPEVVLQRVRNGGLHVWTAAGTPVTMAAITRGALGRIGAVYTDPSRRGRGYASAIVARLSEHLLANGSKKIQLSTDAKNPTSNKIYEAIGYTYVGDSVLIAFER